MVKTVGCVVLSVAVLGCSGDGGHVDEVQEYARLNPQYETRAECDLAHQSDVWLVCVHRIILCPDGTIVTAYTDVLDTGDYEIVGDRIDVDMDTGSEWTMTIAADGSLVSEWRPERPYLRDLVGAPAGYCEIVER